MSCHDTGRAARRASRSASGVNPDVREQHGGREALHHRSIQRLWTGKEA
jgi:hypothetical protein